MGVMYITTVPNRNSPPAILLRESFRHNGTVKNRTLANLSPWLPARIEALRRLLRGEFDQAAELSRAPQLGGVFGLLFVLRQIAEALGMGAALGPSRLAKLARFLVLARVAHGHRPVGGRGRRAAGGAGVRRQPHGTRKLSAGRWSWPVAMG